MSALLAAVVHRLLGEELEPPPALVRADGGGLFTMLESG